MIGAKFISHEALKVKIELEGDYAKELRINKQILFKESVMFLTAIVNILTIWLRTS